MEEMFDFLQQLLLGNGVLIALAVYILAELLKTLLPHLNKSWIPLIGAIVGVGLGMIIPDFSIGQNLLVRAISGMCLGWAATGAFECTKYWRDKAVA